MARLPISRKKRIVAIVVSHIALLNQLLLLWMWKCIALITKHNVNERVKRGAALSYGRNFIRSINVSRIIFSSDLACYDKTRMDRRAFHILCDMLKTIGKLKGSNNSNVEEMVAKFLFMLAHGVKHSVVKADFERSGETISEQFNAVLNAVLCLHKELLKQPQPVLENSTNDKWKWFKNCLGALDGTYINVHVPETDKPRYRSRKGEIATNVLGVCSQDMQFIYILPGWEGSATDSRILRDAISRRNALIVPQGYFYLCDVGYTNGEGFLAPYRGQRYHLTEFINGPQPTTPEEFFNMKHSAARNVIERCFGLVKERWAILRTSSYYPVKTHCRIISACCLLHNHIRKVMAVDPLELEIGEIESNLELETGEIENTSVIQGDRIRYVETSDAWTAWRDDLAREMFNQWRSHRAQ